MRNIDHYLNRIRSATEEQELGVIVRESHDDITSTGTLTPQERKQSFATVRDTALARRNELNAA